ncbi:hypothetical protein PYW08_008644 [Mythimna loreyi]|uniref:Uncharacterized protein n=1 Tax=Mythimna loreyi TaxID=667449 RepID=A0ACC2QBQ4_9NEOP|nr:hypothetical protein PYW08_008644 [Mythimna loreyi]
MRLTIAAVLIFASFLSLDCSTETSSSRLNYFDIDLLRYVAEGKSGNVMVSPASIKSTLAMLLEGARGTTAAEIQAALRLTPNKDDYRHQLSELMKDLRVNTSSVIVQNANGLFASRKLQLNKEYEKMAKRLFYSEVNNVDYNDPRTSADIINGWVNYNTKGLISDIIDQAAITPQTELLVTNALYFKGLWQHEFEPKLTHPDCFFRDGICKTVAMMELDAELNYAYVENLRAHALELPYQGKRYSMMLLVPLDRDAGVALIRDLPYIGLLQISKLLEPTDVILTMPKFTVEYSDDLVTALKNMRITSLFTNAANLSGIFEDPEAGGYINNMIHKVYMQVDEKGTVAAAASAGMVVPLINNYINLRIDRPFLFFIWDNEKGVVLFEGKIEEPTEYKDVNNQLGNNNNVNINKNKDQENVYREPITKPVQIQLTPGGAYISSQSIPIQQLYPIISSYPFTDGKKNVSSNGQETIKPPPSSYPSNDNWTPGPYPNQQQVFVPPSNSQPIQPANKPISVEPNQQVVSQQVNSQPIQPIQPTNPPIPPINEPITTQLTTEAPTKSPHIERRTQPWYKRISGYLG